MAFPLSVTTRARLATVLAAVAMFAALASSGSGVHAQQIDPQVRISQVYGGGGNSGATYTNDFIELYNAGATDVDVSGWSVQYASAGGTSWARTNLAGKIPAHGYYLVQESQGAGGTLSLPPADASGAIQMAATAGKVALVSHQVTLTASPASGPIVDLVGFGSTASWFEGTGRTPAPSNTTAALRRENGCTDTNQNNADFSTGAPTPRNTAAPTYICGTRTLSAVGSASPASLVAGQTVALSVTVTPALDALGPSTGIQVVGDLSAIGGSGQVSFQDAGGNVFTHGFTTPASLPLGAASVTGTVTDQQMRSAAFTITVTVVEPPMPIGAVQGPVLTSPKVGHRITTSGIVTATKFNGYFIQSPDGQGDNDEATSDGLFVFTSSAPAGIARGDLVTVTGTVQEFVTGADPFSPPTTELTGPLTSVASHGHPMPTAAVITSTDPNGGIEQLERFEAMRVSIPELWVVAPTTGAINEPTALASSTSTSSSTPGVFYGVLPSTARPFREPGLETPDQVPSDATCLPTCRIPVFDGNPERVRVDSDGQTGATGLDVGVGRVVHNLVGVFDYAFRSYTLLPDVNPTPAITVSGTLSPAPAAVGGPDTYSIASFNMRRFFDTANDPGTSDPVLTPAAFASRLAKASLIVRTMLHLPDIIGVEEMENLSTLEAVAAKINADAVDAGLADPQYTAHLLEGNDTGGIDVGFLVKGSRVTVLDVTQYGKDDTYFNPVDNAYALLNDRPTLGLRARITGPVGTLPAVVTVLNNHLRSLASMTDAEDGPRVRAKRRAQAEYVARIVEAIQTQYPGEKLVSVGDYNAFQFNDGYVDVLGTIIGTPTPPNQVVLPSPDLVTTDLVNLDDVAPAAERYSYSFGGNAQILDHVLASQSMAATLDVFSHARVSADFPETAGNPLPDGTVTATRLSDHDPAIGYFRFAPDLPPVIATTDVTLEATGALTPVTYAPPTATDDLDGSVAVTCAPASPFQATVGVTTVSCSATDSANHTATASFTVTVQDTTAPVLSTVTPSVTSLWPANHKMVPVTLAYSASDAVGVQACFVAVASNEPANGTGDGNTAADWEVRSPTEVRLRAERAGTGTGRLYTLTVTCRDEAGHATSEAAVVAVPKSAAGR